jgi:hypothetical protein
MAEAYNNERKRISQQYRQETRCNVSKNVLTRIIVLLIVTIVFIVFPKITFASREEPARHYILLLDATAPFRIAIKNSNYLHYMKELLERKPEEVHPDFLPFRANSDIVSIVFFHFPKDASDWRTIHDGLHTSKTLALIRGGIDSVKKHIEVYIEKSRIKSFQNTAISPIGLSEISVLPFLNEYIKRNNINFEERVDRIYLLSLSDEQYNVGEEGIKSELGYIRYEAAKRYHKDLREYMRTNYERLAPLNNIEKKLPSTANWIDKVFFHYYEIKPKLEGIDLNLTNKVALARAALEPGNSGEPEIIWIGNNRICLENQTEYLAWVEWALPPAKNANWNWSDCTLETNVNSNVLSAGCRSGCDGSTSNDANSQVRIVKPDSLQNPEEDAKYFKEEIWYRGVVDMPRKDHKYAYPFKFRYYLDAQKVEYFSNEVTNTGDAKVPHYYSYNIPWYSPENLSAFIGTKIEREAIKDALIKEKLSDPQFLSLVQDYIRSDKLPKRFKEYCDNYREKKITELPAEVLSETSKILAVEQENWAKWRTLIIYLLAIGAVFFVYRFYLRPIIVRFNIDSARLTNNSILVDFSAEEQEMRVIANVELENIVYTLHPAKRNPRFKLSFNVTAEFSYPGEPLTVNYEHENLFTILDKSSNKEYHLKSGGNTYHVTLPDARFEGRFALLLNLSAIKDVQADNIGDKIVPLTLTLNSPAAKTRRGHKLNIHKMKAGATEIPGKQWEHNINLQFKPENHKKEITIKPARGAFIAHDESHNPGTGENFGLEFTSKNPLKKLYEIEIQNNVDHHFSYPVEGTFSFKVKGAGNKSVSNIFHLSERDVDSPVNASFIRELPLRLKKGDGRKKLYFYINFDEFPNPVDHTNYTVNSYFNGDIVKVLHIRINRSKEETEALVRLEDEAQAVLLNITDDTDITDDNCLLVHKNSPKTISSPVQIPVAERKGIKEGTNTRLFTILLKNNCSTKTGYFDWELRNISVKDNTKVEFETNPVKLMPKENSGTIEDRRDSEQDIEFWLDYTKIKKINTYKFGFSLIFSLSIRLFPNGTRGQNQTPAGGEKQIDFSLDFNCFHDVKDNYLVMDFGTSAICAYYYTDYQDTPENKYSRIPLTPPKGHMESEDDLLPSIINLRNTVNEGQTNAETIMEPEGTNQMAVAGTEHFVDLPAIKDIFSVCPETVLSSIKLLIVQGMEIVPVPKNLNYGLFGEQRPFTFINENGNRQDGNPHLSSVLKSCYENFLKNYIKDTPKTDERRYRKVILTYPNVYNDSHTNFLKNQVFEDVFQESGRIYLDNIGMESESNSVLYYYLSKRNPQDVPDLETILIIDIGAGTMDMSYAEVLWNKWDQDIVTPESIEIVKRDGIAMAGDTLDKAIALQVHDLIKQFTQFEDVDYANPIAGSGDRNLGKESKNELRTRMFSFKIKHILNFKKAIVTAEDDQIVAICLGENDKNKGLVEQIDDIHEITLNGAEDEEPVTVTQANKFGSVHISMTKAQWLNLPYLKRFEQLLVEKMKAFSREFKIADDLTIVLSGRTSLWPAIQDAVTVAFEGENINIADNIWPPEAGQKAAELKRAVILGAIQKATVWQSVDFREKSVTGLEAVRYQRGADGSNPDSWRVEVFQKNSDPTITINLANSSYFELGIKTSMDFVPFMGADSHKRDEYCKKNKEITITYEKIEGTNEYKFYVKSDKYKKGKGTRLKYVLSHETAFLKTRAKYWPVRNVQLQEIEPHQFSENV